MYRLLTIFTLVVMGSSYLASPPGGPPKLPRANAEAEQKLKEAYACYVQGWYERAIALANEVYEKYGDVQAKWFPSWVQRVMKKRIPNPYEKGEVLKETLEGPFLFTMAIKSVFPSYLLARSYAAMGDKEKALLWKERIIELGFSPDFTLGPSPSPPRKGIRPRIWQPLPLPFREEDYFILVPLDQACKVLGIPFRYKVNPKTGKRTGAQIGEKGLISLMGRPFARNIKGEIDDMAYAPYEEGGVVWVPFYWLAKQAGIRWWEVRDGKIYVAPK
ncbi:MAG: hypothetical protein LM632_01145 [Armatimonadetes bacterium]|nr:hypothetical protein [Armatimonadota bacterium]